MHDARRQAVLKDRTRAEYAKTIAGMSVRNAQMDGVKGRGGSTRLEAGDNVLDEA
jgi:hypothetical protein